MIQIWQVPSECGPSNLVVLELDQGIVNWSGAAQYAVEGPKQSL